MQKTIYTAIIIFIMVNFSGCTKVFLPKVTTIGDVKSKHTHQLYTTNQQARDSLKLTIKQLNWSLLGVSTKLSMSAVNIKPPKEASKKIYFKIKTPMTLFSYGAIVYVAIYNYNYKTYMRLSGVAQQIVERKKLPQYLNTLYKKTKLNIKD